MRYKDRINDLIDSLELGIDKDIIVTERIPTSVSSEFLTNKEQGDWAERLVYSSINGICDRYIAVRYGRSDDISAGHPDFKRFYRAYQEELNTIGKKPDLLIFNRSDYSDDQSSEETVKKAICAIEVRSSSFLLKKYNSFMGKRTNDAYEKIEHYISLIKEDTVLDSLLRTKNEAIYNYIHDEDRKNKYASISFSHRKWSSTPDLEKLSSYLKEIKDGIQTIQKRTFLSITPKLEDIALVNRWIQNYDVPHYYLQVFFDCAYIISFEDILKICADSKNEDTIFSIEQDVKNQRKTTIKVNVNYTKLFIDNIEIPRHYSEMRELDRGRLLFFVKFKDGRGDIDLQCFNGIMNENERKQGES